jgi:hypothetical protein
MAGQSTVASSSSRQVDELLDERGRADRKLSALSGVVYRRIPFSAAENP